MSVLQSGILRQKRTTFFLSVLGYLDEAEATE